MNLKLVAHMCVCVIWIAQTTQSYLVHQFQSKFSWDFGHIGVCVFCIAQTSQRYFVQPFLSKFTYTWRHMCICVIMHCPNIPDIFCALIRNLIYMKRGHICVCVIWVAQNTQICFVHPFEANSLEIGSIYVCNLNFPDNPEFLSTSSQSNFTWYWGL